MTDAADEPGPATSDLLASSVHDIKNSLGLIIGLVDDLDEQLETPPTGVGRALASLRYEGRRLNTQLVQLLSLYRLSERTYPVHATEVHVDDFLDECRATYEVVLRARDIVIEVRREPGLVGYFDRELVSGVMGTVVNNAYRYASARVQLSASEHDRWLRFGVADDGPGYPETMLRGEPDTGISFKTGSSGLGLYFAAVVAAAHRNKDKRGYVTVDNDGLDGGGRFMLHLP